MLELNWTVFVQMIWLVLAWFFLSRLLFKPMLRLIELRRNKTVGFSAEAAKLREETQAIFSQVEERLRSARQEISQVYQSTREKHLTEARAVVEEARLEIEKLNVINTQKRETEMRELRREMSARAQELAPLVVSKMLSA